MRINENIEYTNAQDLGIYIHIPFCVQKCKYCDFLSSPATNEMMEKYIKALSEEMQAFRKQFADRQIKTLFIGGGTPSILTSDLLKILGEQINTNFSLNDETEFSIECNPGTLDKEKVQVFKEVGINRISLGLQSVYDQHLKELGRIHSYNDFLQSYDLLRTEGFGNINIDLISALPDQTLRNWEENLRKIIELSPEHISAYSLMIEEGTVFHQQLDRGRLPSEEEERSMYTMSKEILQNTGYLQYEISNFAKPGFSCKHNISYWIRKDYLGLGLGAASLIHDVRYKNTADLNQYIQHAGKIKYIQEEKQVLSKEEQMEEFVFLGLRMTQGISLKEFSLHFKVDFKQVYGEVLKDLLDKQLLMENHDRIALTAQGTDLSNYVFVQFLL